MEENKVEDNKNEFAKIINEVFQWVNAVILALIIALLIRGILFEPVMVKGDSMNDTLADNQRLLVYKLGYFFSKPERGDIVVLQYQAGTLENIEFLDNIPIFRRIFPDFKEINYIKRAIALPGDTVDIREGHVYVNGEELEEPYIKGRTEPLGMSFPTVVPDNSVFVLGDNRQHSSDSRVIGFVRLSKIKGKAVFRFYPFNKYGTVGK